MKNLDIDMCGIGPYIEHKDTPLFEPRDLLSPIEQRYNLTLKVIALLRIMMKDINIAASTALQSANKVGREKALNIAANVHMPNITPSNVRKDFTLYDNKPCIYESPQDCGDCSVARINLINGRIAFGEAGDSIHFLKRNRIVIN
jgi:biotin synthase